MKRLLILILAAAMLLVGCDKPAETTVETAEHITTEVQQTTASAVMQTTAAPVHTEVSAEGGQQTPVGGVSLTEEHKELREAFSGADEYCDYSELGLTTTVCDDFVQRAFQLAEQSEGFDGSFVNKRSGRCLGVDDGCFYFSVMYIYEKYIEEAEWLLNTYVDCYFCYNCDTDEVTQISALDDYPEIEAVSNEVMVLRDEKNNYAAVYRESGFLAELPAPLDSIVIIDDTVYYQYLEVESDAVPVGWTGSESIYMDGHTAERGIVRVGWTVMEKNRYSCSSASVFDQAVLGAGMIDYPDYPDFIEQDYNYLAARYSISRGVYNIVCQCNDNTVRTLNNKEYLVLDPCGRVKDFILQTYYQGTVIAEENLLGSRLRFSITDRSGKEYVLGFAQSKNRYTENRYFITGVKIHATKDGVIFLDKGDELLMLVTEPDNMGYAKVAFIPEDIFHKDKNRGYDVYCDDERIYLFDYEVGKLVSVCI